MKHKYKPIKYTSIRATGTPIYGAGVYPSPIITNLIPLLKLSKGRVIEFTKAINV